MLSAIEHLVRPPHHVTDWPVEGCTTSSRDDGLPQTICYPKVTCAKPADTLHLSLTDGPYHLDWLCFGGGGGCRGCCEC